MAATLRAGGVDASRIVVVPSGVALDELAVVRPLDLRARHGWPAGTPLILNVAALTPEKGHATLLRAAAALRTRRPEARWLVAGDGPGRAGLARVAESLGVQDVVHFLGHVDDVAAHLAAANVVVSASEAEGLGTTLIDAMALGRPIVATAVGGVPELLAPDAGALVPAGDAHAIAAAVRQLLDDPAGAAALGARARRAAGAFGADRMAERTSHVYRSLTMVTERA